MIVVRDVFHLKFGKAREAREALLRGAESLREAGYGVDRVLVDVTGRYYRLVMESRFANVAEFESALDTVSSNESWSQAYRDFVPLVENGEREILREVG